MRYSYTIYPEAKEKLDSAGISARIKEAREDHSIGIGGCIMQSEIRGLVGDMKERGFFKTFPQDKLADFKAKANSLFATPERYKWLVHKYDKVYEDSLENEDILSLVGYDASHVLTPNEIWDFERFGFKNLTDFLGSVSALISNEIHNSTYKKGLAWQTKTLDNRILANEVTGDHNFDLRAFQRDITPYKTIDPFGNEVSFRPEIESDLGGLMAYHSTEAVLLTIILRYVDQIGLKPESLKDGAKAIREWSATLGQHGMGCTEHFGGFDRESAMFFTGWGFPFRRLNDNGTTTGSSIDGIVTEGRGAYLAYLDKNNNLVFTFEPEKKSPNRPKKVNAIYHPEDIDPFIKGLLYQSAKGFGRTSCQQLRNILEYRFSDQLAKDLEIINHMLGNK